MLEFAEARGAGSRNPTSEMERLVSSMVLTREPVTESYLSWLVAIIAPVIGTRFELKPIAARQAVKPILRRLLRVEPDMAKGARRTV